MPSISARQVAFDEAVAHDNPYLEDQVQGLVPAPDGGDDLVSVAGPGEASGCIADSTGKRLMAGHTDRHVAENAPLQPASGELGEEPSIALSHEHEVGVKWKTMALRKRMNS